MRRTVSSSTSPASPTCGAARRPWSTTSSSGWRHGLTARAAVAGNPAAAWALARFGEDRTIVPEGAEAEALAALPVTALRLEVAVAAQIVRLGLVPPSAASPPCLGTRSPAGSGPPWSRLDQALGRAREGLDYRRPPTPWLARLAFAEPISAPEDMAG